MLDLLLVLLSASASSAMTYEQAHLRAQKDQASLPAAKRQDLYATHNRIAAIAFDACMPMPAPKQLPAFTIVMELNAQGQVSNTWLNNKQTSIARCMQLEFAGKKTIKPVRAPFYTSFEFTPGPRRPAGKYPSTRPFRGDGKGTH